MESKRASGRIQHALGDAFSLCGIAHCSRRDRGSEEGVGCFDITIETRLAPCRTVG